MTMSKGLEKVASFMFDVSSVTALTSFSLAMMMMGKSNLKQLKVGSRFIDSDKPSLNL